MPTIINDNIYINSLVGLTYVLDTNAQQLNPEALLSVNDLGTAGKCWSGNPLSYLDGMIFHRSIKELFCIQNEEQK